MKKDQHLKLRTTKEVSDMVDELVEYYSAISIAGTINKTTVIELAIKELHKRMGQTKEQELVK